MRIKEILIIALITVAALGILEIACRISGAGRRADADFRFYIRNVDNDLRLDYVREDPLLMWSLKPGYKDRNIAINNRGFRDADYDTEKPAATFRILCLGDSSTFGYRMPLESTYHALLEERLNHQPENHGRRYEVINAGVVGYTALQGLEMYLSKGSRFKPDLVMAYFGVNDTNRRFYLSDADIMKTDRPQWLRLLVNKWLLKLDLVRLLRKQAAVVAGKRDADARRLKARVSPAEYHATILKLKAVCDRHDAQLLLISPPLRVGANPDQGRAMAIAFYRKVLEQTAAEAAIPLLTIPEMTEHAVTDPAELFLDGDSVHPSRDGHRLIMQRIYEFILKNGMLK